MFTRADADGALFLDAKRRRSERGGVMDLEASRGKTAAFMPWHYETELQKTDDTDTILGYAVRRYRVVREP